MKGDVGRLDPIQKNKYRANFDIVFGRTSKDAEETRKMCKKGIKEHKAQEEGADEEVCGFWGMHRSYEKKAEKEVRRANILSAQSEMPDMGCKKKGTKKK